MGTRPHNKRKVVRMRKPFRIRIGYIILLFIVIYLIIIIMNYLGKTHISIYEVTEKSIADDNTCRGMAIRDETIVKSQKAGYINYYIAGDERVSKNETVYSVDESGNIHEMLADSGQNTKLTNDDISNIRNDIKAFHKDFNGTDYTKVQNYKTTMDNTVLELTSMDMLKNLNSVTVTSGSSTSFQIVSAPESGIISYFVDGYSNIKADDVTKEMFDKDYERTMTRTDKIVKTDTPVYKLVNDENWSIVLNLSEKQYKTLKAEEKEQLAEGSETADMIIRLVKAGIDKRVEYTLKKKGDGFFAVVTLNKYMVHYIDDRFLDIELDINSEEGLKIPKTAILKKEFYVVPNDYLATGGDSDSNGVILETYNKNGEIEYVFTPAEIYYQDEENSYLNTSLFEMGSYIYNEKTKEHFQTGQTAELEGVYNTNKGYCVFKRIEKICGNDEYCIVAKDTSFGISAYDHIIVDAKTVDDQEIISKN